MVKWVAMLEDGGGGRQCFLCMRWVQCSGMWCGAGVGTCDGNSIVDLANEATIDACLGMK